MSSSLNLTLTDELRAFIDRACKDGTLYVMPTEFIRNVGQVPLLSRPISVCHLWYMRNRFQKFLTNLSTKPGEDQFELVDLE